MATESEPPPPVLGSWRRAYALVLGTLAAVDRNLRGHLLEIPLRPLDWAVLLGTIFAIVGWGVWKERGAHTADEYLSGGRDQKWWTIGLSIMATQASAITFLSMPGQAYTDGLGFIQFYLGSPIAMVLLSAFVVPIYYRLKFTQLTNIWRSGSTGAPAS